MLIDIDPRDSQSLIASCRYPDKWRLDALPAKAWDTGIRKWVIPIIHSNIAPLRSNFTASEFTPEAIARIKATLATNQIVSRETPEFTGHLVPGTMAHQRAALAKSQYQESYFFAHAMGSGKSLTVLTLAAHLHRHQGLTGLLVVCPASIKHDVWQQEVAKWMPDLKVDHDLHILTAGKHAKAISWIAGRIDTPGVKVLVVGIQALSNKDQAAYQVCSRFLTTFKTGMLIDESSLIKNAKASRTKNVIELGGLAHWRWNGTGTKITQGIHDLYAQFRFLDWRILGHKSFHTFKNRYCVMGGFEDKSIISYKNVDELLALIDPHIDVIRKEDANDLPPKTYQTRTVAPSELQTRLFKELKQYMEASVSTEHDLTVATALERMTRYQQLAGGNIPYRDDDGQWHTKPMTVNPKLEELESLMEEIDGKVIIWAVFVPEIRMIAAKLAAAHGPEAVVSYYGGVEVAARSAAVDRFQHDPRCRFFVANQATAGKGLTLTAATTTIYYSNSFSYEDRVQSEDRNHRTGQRHSVTYIDLFVDLPIDRTIKAALTKKTSMSKYIADRLRSGSPTVLEAD